MSQLERQRLFHLAAGQNHGSAHANNHRVFTGPLIQKASQICGAAVEIVAMQQVGSNLARHAQQT
jgi:hypothetical protein